MKGNDVMELKVSSNKFKEIKSKFKKEEVKEGKGYNRKN